MTNYCAFAISLVLLMAIPAYGAEDIFDVSIETLAKYNYLVSKEEDNYLVSTRDNCLLIHGYQKYGKHMTEYTRAVATKLSNMFWVPFLPESHLDKVFQARRLDPLDSDRKAVSLMDQRWYSSCMGGSSVGAEGLYPIDARVDGLVTPPPDLPAFIGLNQRYRMQRHGTMDIYPFVELELAKPYLLHVNGRFFSVFGDCKVAEHRVLPEYSFMPVVVYGYNTMYLYTTELVPILHSAGVDANGRIWLTSVDGWLAFFDTENRTFLEGPVDQKALPGALVARDNRSSSYFAPRKEDNRYNEWIVDFDDEKNAILRPGAAVLPADVRLILYSDEHHVVFAEENNSGEDNGRIVRVRRLVRGESDYNTLHEIPLSADEHVYEGVYLPDVAKTFLLIGIPPKSGISPTDGGKPDWRSVRLVKP